MLEIFLHELCALGKYPSFHLIAPTTKTIATSSRKLFECLESILGEKTLAYYKNLSDEDIVSHQGGILTTYSGLLFPESELCCESDRWRAKCIPISCDMRPSDAPELIKLGAILDDIDIAIYIWKRVIIEKLADIPTLPSENISDAEVFLTIISEIGQDMSEYIEAVRNGISIEDLII